MRREIKGEIKTKGKSLMTRNKLKGSDREDGGRNRSRSYGIVHFFSKPDKCHLTRGDILHD